MQFNDYRSIIFHLTKFLQTMHVSENDFEVTFVKSYPKKKSYICKVLLHVHVLLVKIVTPSKCFYSFQSTAF